MNVHIELEFDRLQQEIEQIDADNSDTSAHSELSVWRIITSAPREGLSRRALTLAIEQGKLQQTIAAWSDAQIAEFTAVDGSAERLAIWWTHPLTHDQMVVVPPGRALLRNPAQSVQVNGFSLARFPVTNEQFLSFVSESGYQPADSQEHGAYLNHWQNSRPPARRPKHPVTWVNVFDALAYCRWATAELPTEIQWEKAARGDDGRRFPWGNAVPFDWIRKKQKFANLNKTDTCRVGSFPDTRSPYGCEDMSGNVSQWVTPELIPDFRKNQSQVRGGCFYRKSNATVEASHQRWLNALRRNQWVGLRICVS